MREIICYWETRTIGIVVPYKLRKRVDDSTTPRGGEVKTAITFDGDLVEMERKCKDVMDVNSQVVLVWRKVYAGSIQYVSHSWVSGFTQQAIAQLIGI